MDQNMQQDRMLSPQAVWDRVGLRKTALKKRIKAGSFPRPVKLGPNRVAWLESEIAEWIRQQALARDRGR